MEKDLTSISSVGEKESFLVDCREALLGLKLKGLARRQNSFLSGHKQAQKNRIIAQKQGNKLTIYEYLRPFPTPTLFGVIVRSTTTRQADLEAQLHAHFLPGLLNTEKHRYSATPHTDRTSGKHN